MPQVKEREGSGIVRGRGGGNGGGNEPGGLEAFPVPTARLGLWIFMAVATVLFSALVSAYLVRMNLPDWKSLSEPGLLGLNTALLALASLFLQQAAWASRRYDLGATRRNLQLGGLLGFAFVAGQLLAWSQLQAMGYFLVSNPSASFFYLMTALHGLHLLGGLVAWGVVGSRVPPSALSVQLCTTYWHFLLLVWLGLYGLLLLT
ncbi:MAG: cytochrome oxidase subunit III [Meiothermus sp.]